MPESAHPAPWTIKHCPDEGCDRYVVVDHLDSRVTDNCVDYGIAASTANGINMLAREDAEGVA